MTGSRMEPETRVSSRPVFDGRIIKVRVDTVRLPDGRQALREVVDHRPAVVLVPVDEAGNVLLVRQFRYAVGGELLEAPAGVVEDQETPEECAQRELREETGYRAGSIRRLGGFWTGPGFCNEFIHAFLATGLTPGSLAADPDENITVERVPLATVRELIHDGSIQDAKTIAALLMAAMPPEGDRLR